MSRIAFTPAGSHRRPLRRSARWPSRRHRVANLTSLAPVRAATGASPSPFRVPCGGWWPLSGECCQLGPVGNAELGVHVGEVSLHCAAAHKTPHTDLRVGETFGDEMHHLELGRCEAGPAGGGAAPTASCAADVADRVIDGHVGAGGPRLPEVIVSKPGAETGDGREMG